MENTQFYDLIAKDSKQALIQLVSEAGHGKDVGLYVCGCYIGRLIKSVLESEKLWTAVIQL